MAAPFLTGGPDAANAINGGTDFFAYTNEPALPVVPDHLGFFRGAPAGAQIKISGGGFSTVTSVRFGASPAAYSVISDAEIHATMPPGLPSTTFTVTNPDGSVTGTFTRYFWKEWEQPADVDYSGSLLITHGTTPHKFEAKLPWGSGAPAFSGAVTHPAEASGFVGLRAGEEVNVGSDFFGPIGDETAWIRIITIGLLQPELFMLSGAPTTAERSDFRFVGYQNDSIVIGEITSDVVLNYTFVIGSQLWSDDSAKTATPADSMQGKVQLLRPADSDWGYILQSGNPHPVINGENWPPPAMLAGWEVIDEEDITNRHTYTVSGGNLFSNVPDGDLSGGYTRAGVATFSPADFHDSPQFGKTIPLVLSLDRFAEGVLLAEPGTADNHAGSKRTTTFGGGTFDADADFWAPIGFIETNAIGVFTYRPSRYRVLVTEPDVPDLSAALTAAVRSVTALQPLLHIPFVETVFEHIVAADNYVDAVLLSGANGGVVFDITGFTTEVGEVNVAAHSCWFHWVAPVSGTAVFTTKDTPAPRWDSILSAYTDIGVLPTNTELLDSEDDNDLQPVVVTADGFGTSSVTFACVAGQTYAIQVSSYDYPAITPNPSAGYPRTDARLAWSVT